MKMTDVRTTYDEHYCGKKSKKISEKLKQTLDKHFPNKWIQKMCSFGSYICIFWDVDKKRIFHEFSIDELDKCIDLDFLFVNLKEQYNYEDKCEILRLKAQLDREIHINRKMKSCLSAFARRDNWKAIEGCADWLFLLDPLMAEETLKEIKEME